MRLRVSSYVLWKRTKTVIRTSYCLRLSSVILTHRDTQAKTKANERGLHTGRWRWLHANLIARLLLNSHGSWTKSHLTEAAACVLKAATIAIIGVSDLQLLLCEKLSLELLSTDEKCLQHFQKIIQSYGDCFCKEVLFSQSVSQSVDRWNTKWNKQLLYGGSKVKVQGFSFCNDVTT